MHTIKLQIDDSLYEKLANNNIDIQATVEDYLTEYVEDDGYPAISTEEAKRRVSEVVEKYRSGKMKTVSVDKAFWNNIEKNLLQRQRKIS